MLKKLIIITTLFILSISAFALTKEQIEPEMRNKIDKVLMILKDSKINKNAKAKEIINIMDSVFDYPLMSRLSLGRTWKELSDAQQKEFIELFTKELKGSYVSKLDLYTDELVKILGTKSPKANRIELQTVLVGKSDKYEINYKFYEASKEENKWLIYDVELVGVSIIQTYRQQYAGYLKNNSFDDLLKFMKNKKIN
ncbi:MAG: ABC transporter substrate-binding protein [Halarcobacter sp.]